MTVKSLKLLTIILLFLLITNITIRVQAISIDKIWSDGSSFLEKDEDSEETTFNGNKMEDAIQSLYKLFMWGGIAVTVIVGTYLGINFITGGIEGKAKIKEALIPFGIGCIVIFGAFTIWNISMNLFSTLENTEKTTTKNAEQCLAGNHQWVRDNNFVHHCTNCGKSENHDMKDGSCKCGAICRIHDYHSKGQYIVCNNCGTKYENCRYQGRAEHQWGTDGHCVNCHIPKAES